MTISSPLKLHSDDKNVFEVVKIFNYTTKGMRCARDVIQESSSIVLKEFLSPTFSFGETRNHQKFQEFPQS